MCKHEFTHNNKYHLSLIQINDEHSYDENRSYIFVFLLRVGGSTHFKHLKKIPSFEVVQVAFANTAPFREKNKV